MAIFNFRWPGQKEESEQAPMRRSRVAQAESVEDMRRRARHRLIGAAVLVVLGVIGFPILFDTQPRPIPVDVPIEIPDRNQVAPLMVPGTVAKGSDGLAQSQAAAGSTVVDGALSDGEEMVDIAPPAPVAIPQPPEPPRLVPVPAKPEVKLEPAVVAPRPVAPPVPEPKPVPPPEPKPEPKPTPTPTPKPAVDEATRARALLEGRAAPTPASAPTAAAEGRFIVQVGAFADAGKANEVRSKLERAGLKTYTQVVQTKDGARTRVRVGPFNGRDDADKAATRIKSLGLAASVLTL